jgi:hypothetical protein
VEEIQQPRDGREVASFCCNSAEMTLTACHLNAAFWKQNKWKLGEIPYDFETENVLNG